MPCPDRILTRFEDDLGIAEWFAAAGATPSATVLREIEVYLDGLDQRAGRVETVGDWTAAGAILRCRAWNPSWRAAEQAEQQALSARVESALADPALARRLSAVLVAAGDRALADAKESLRRAGISDPGLAASAAGAAAEAVHQASLAAIAGTAETHPFRVKLRRFVAGDWPLGLFGDIFLLL